MYDGFWEVENDSYIYTITNTTSECVHGWEYDRSQFSETFPSEVDWVCTYKDYAPHTLSINVVGRALGTLLLPLLADNYIGRRRMFFLAVGTYVVFTIPLHWIYSAPLTFLFRFLNGIGYETNYLMPYVIMMEIIPPSRRDLVVMMTFVSWTVGICITSVVAWLVGNWRPLNILTIVPFVCLFAYWRVLPESPRWLLSKGRLRECADILLQIGASNGASKVSREEVEEELRALTIRLPPNEPLTRAFVHPKLRLRAIMLYVLSCTQFIVYGVILMSMSVMPGNYFVSHLVLSVFEIPSAFVGLAVTHYFGRRFLGYSSLLLGALCFVAAPFCVHNKWLLLGVLAVAKLSCTCTLYLVFLLPAEILPTPVRTSGAGLVVVSGMLGMTLSPQLLHSGMGEGMHYWVLLAITGVGMISLFPIPETLGLIMPQTFKESEELGTGRPLTTWIHHWNLHKYPGTPQHEDEDDGKDEERHLVNGKEC
ncbi:solute carrier family 22 member 21-like isoform X2 [Eriocheir sinensis]|nr:solute carrier family 22 member 21-like isoform X2 [Eriocheir sinensis]